MEEFDESKVGVYGDAKGLDCKTNQVEFGCYELSGLLG
jgi:hypothetical protein